MSVVYGVWFVLLGLFPWAVGRRVGRLSLRDWLCLGWGLALASGALTFPGPEMALVLVVLTIGTLRAPRKESFGYVNWLPVVVREEDELEEQLAEAAELAVMVVHPDHALITLASELSPAPES